MRAAFFDVDNTMVMGASIFHFAKGLAARKYFTFRDLAAFGIEQVRFRMLGTENVERMNRARDTALSFVAGRSVAEIIDHGEQIYDELMADRIWDGTRRLAQAHLAAGDEVWLVTATPVELARIIASRLGLTGALGTESEIVDGRYTGRLTGGLLHGTGKATAISELAERRGFELSECLAYSDSINDLPMLNLVGTAVAVNPDRRLRAYAKARGWGVRDFRTGRRAVKIGIPTAAGLGAVAGGLAVGLALRNKRRSSHND